MNILSCLCANCDRRTMNEVKVKVLLVQAKNKCLIKEKKSKQKRKRSKFVLRVTIISRITVPLPEKSFLMIDDITLFSLEDFVYLLICALNKDVRESSGFIRLAC